MDEEISVIIPCYNDSEFVGKTVEAVLAQTCEPIEIIAVNDGSDDRSPEILESYSDQIRVIHHQNQGASAARNRGAEVADGDYLMFLDADDLIAPNTLSALRDAIDESEEACVVAACRWKTLWYRENEWVSQDTPHSLDPPSGDPLYGWLSGWYIPPCAILWSREAYNQVGEWNQLSKDNPIDDAEIMMRAFLEGVEIVKANLGMAYYRNYEEPGTSLSGQQSKRALKSQARVFEAIAKQIEERGRKEEYVTVLGRQYYNLARKAALVDDDLYQSYLERARELAGDQAPIGPLTHRVSSAILGLKRKEKLAAKLAEWGLNPKWGVNKSGSDA